MDIQRSSYDTLKMYYNDTLNKDKTTYKSSNDEPTPVECVEEMLNILPKEFWEKQDLKLLDPCCGNGNFHLVAYNKLKEHHDIQHITENILYFNDINNDRIDNVKKVFCDDKFSLNITTEDFLETKYDDKFDAVIANPPYAKILNDGKRASKNHNLIKLFLDKSLSILKPNGYLVFITPDNWMSYADRNEIIKKLTELQILN
jgi:type I restriction-modification system DNA methylase subunit